MRQVPTLLPRSERKPPSFDRSFHVVHKLPASDSPYARAKHVQLVDKDPHRAISMFWAALNSGDRVDSALKDMALAMKQVNRPDEAIEAIKSFRYLCSLESQESLDNILLELYKRSGRMEEHIEVLQAKIKHVEKGLLLGGRRVKNARSHGKKSQITVEHEYSRLLGNLAWVYLQQNKFTLAEELYRKALSLEQDKNKQCNLAICLMYTNRMTEAKLLLKCARSSENGLMEATHVKSFERASQILAELESPSCEETRKAFSSFLRRDTEGNVSGDQNSGSVVSRKSEDSNNQELLETDDPKRVFCSWNDSIVSSSHIESPESASLGPGIGLQSSHITSFAGKLNRERSYVKNYNERTASETKWNDNQEMVAGGGITYDGYMIGYDSPNPVGGSPRVPYTEPRKGSSYLFDNAGGCSRKLSFADIGEQGAILGLGQASGVEKCANQRKNDQELQSQCQPIKEVIKHFSLDSSNKDWANMRAGEDVQLPKNEYFDENTNCNIFSGSLVPLNQTERLNQKMESLALEGGYVYQASNADISTNQEVRNSMPEAESKGQVRQSPWMFQNMK
ncbi:Tetratricopeptide repeat protein [Heracleum sosnowskyi]|uniref:Tetratricopeptide repeat protein n=1 Tax=Heracleum sosnowskyi TaxID=360622 RepID=A0AAD8MYK4_9APIA|nr:Tetratricopeptide repeat protein [Heracleum sosnowskyi]